MPRVELTIEVRTIVVKPTMCIETVGFLVVDDLADLGAVNIHHCEARIRLPARSGLGLRADPWLARIINFFEECLRACGFRAEFAVLLLLSAFGIISGGTGVAITAAAAGAAVALR